MTLHSLVVRYPTEGWGSEEDLDKRHHLEDLLHLSLGACSNGKCEGGDIGSGAINIYLEGVADVPRACDTILVVLTQAQALEGMTIAECHQVPSEMSPDEYNIAGYTVLWPPGSKKEFDT